MKSEGEIKAEQREAAVTVSDTIDEKPEESNSNNSGSSDVKAESNADIKLAQPMLPLVHTGRDTTA